MIPKQNQASNQYQKPSPNEPLQLNNNLLKQKKQKIKTTFLQFRSYCKKISESLNNEQNYFAEYQIIKHPLLREHDAQYLIIEHKSCEKFIKINILYSLSYQIPLFYFMIFDMDHSSPFSLQKISQTFPKIGVGTLLWGENVNTGVFVSQNPLTKEYMYTLHSCELSLEIQYLIPFYLNLLQLHPEINIQNSDPK